MVCAGGGVWNRAQALGNGVVAEVRPAGRQLVLEVTNEGRKRVLQIVLSLGSESEMREIGQAVLTILPDQSLSLLLDGLSWNSGSENRYVLAVYEISGVNERTGRSLIIYRHATLRQNSDPAPGNRLALNPIQRNGRTTESSDLSITRPETSPQPIRQFETFVPPPPVQLQAQLLSNPGNPVGAILSIDLQAERPIEKATLEISYRKYRDSKPVNIERNLNLGFELPDNFADDEGEPSVHYRLLDRDRSLLIEGDLPVSGLTEVEQIGLKDLQTDQPSYRPGDQVRITIFTEGSTRHGINIELAIRNERGEFFHRDQRLIPPNGQDQAPIFIFLIPASIKGPLTIEYQLLDPRQGRLHDAGQRELVIREEM